jgi:tRNA pseudouridine38-40 synthase
MDSPPLFNTKLIIAYDGTHYSGWQIQPNGVTIQELLEKHIHTFTREHVVVIGSGRTDAGVHAHGQTAHFTHVHPLDYSRFMRSLNGLLPLDIKIKSAESVPLNFHAQYSAKGKIYHYHIRLNQISDPFRRLYQWHAWEKANPILIKQAASYFVGTHDFTSFANEAHSGCAAEDPIRTIYRLDVIEEEGGLRLEFEGNGFLYKMVRNIVGLIFDIAAGKRHIEEIPQIFAAKDRRKAGRAAPPEGLFLVEVLY